MSMIELGCQSIKYKVLFDEVTDFQYPCQRKRRFDGEEIHLIL